MRIPMFSQDVFITQTNLKHKNILKELKKLKFNKVSPQTPPNFDTKHHISKDFNILNNFSYGKEITLEMKKVLKLAIESFGFNCDFYIINSWVNKIQTGNYSEWHHHLNFWLSLVYYPHGTFSISFAKHQMDYFDIPVKTQTTMTNTLHTFYVKEGTMIVFPSYLKHKIGYNDTNIDRYSIAVNILPKGTIGVGDGKLTIA